MLSWAPTFLPAIKVDLPRLNLIDSYSKERQKIGTGGLYVCGITPYDATHLGHAATYLTFDLVNRYLTLLGDGNNYTQNVTDIDEPLFERARRDEVDWKTLGDNQVQLYRDDMTALRVLPPTNFLGVVENMELIIEYIERLVATGKTYNISSDIYLDIAQVDGALTNLPLPIQEAVQIFRERGGDPDRAGKRHPLDPLLWVTKRENEPVWKSSLGDGRPGWHIECVALALSSLDGASTGGETSCIAIQGGGEDLKFPHHYMSGVQAKALTGREFASCYVHSGMIGLAGEKMSKSKGNLVFVSSLIKEGIDPMAIRVALLNRHYRSDLMWSDSILIAAQNFLLRLRENLARQEVAPTGSLILALATSLSDDLNTPQVFQEIDDWCTATESGVTGGNPGELARVLDALLGIAL
jgi:L-cysteine:1D-myo-inositol 2-amino-2-deoxy-alpha-D-glucopyranoside ligase